LDLLPARCNIPVDLLERFQQAVCGGLCRGSFRVTGIQSSQFFIPFGQTTPNVKLEQGQDAQSGLLLRIASAKEGSLLPIPQTVNPNPLTPLPACAIILLTGRSDRLAKSLVRSVS